MLFIRGSRFFFSLRKSKSPQGQYVPYAIGNKNPRNKNYTIIEIHASAVCVSVFGQFWMGYHGSVPLKTQILRFKKFKMLDKSIIL